MTTPAMTTSKENGVDSYANFQSPFPNATYRPAMLTQPHNLRAALKLAGNDESKALFGVGQGIPSVFLSKVYAQTGTDFIWFDLEHSMWDRSSIYDAIHAVHHHSEGRTFVIVRVPKEDEISLSTALDAGADGIILPHTDSVEEVKKLIKNTRFPPLGQRSFSPWVSAPFISTYSTYPDDMWNVKTANNHVAIIPQIESAQGLAVVEDIAAMEEVSALLFGPGDFRMDIGLPLSLAKPWDEPKFLEAVARVGNAAKSNGKPALGNAPDDKLPAMLSMGYRVMISYMDYWHISQDVVARNKSGREIALKNAKNGGE